MQKDEPIYLLDLENAKDRAIGVKALLETFSMSEIVEEKYCCALNLMGEGLDGVIAELNSTMKKIHGAES